MGCAGSKSGGVKDYRLIAESERNVKAATKLQSGWRGATGRRTSQQQLLLGAYASRTAPCERYRVNMEAANFGDCLCGFPKSDHSANAFVTVEYDRAKPVTRLDSISLRSRMLKKDKAVCELYQVNMQALDFGECVNCKRPKAEHTDSALRAGDGDKKMEVLDEVELQKKMMSREMAKCTRYQVNMQALNFGECMCGIAKALHTDSALRAGGRTGKESDLVCVDEKTLREKMTQRETTGCERYQVDMNPMAPFGQCICGRAKSQHSERALRGVTKKETYASRDSEEVRSKMLQRETCDCVEYKLDISPNAPFGQCVCGFPKGKHSDLALRGAKYKPPPPPPLLGQSGKEVASAIGTAPTEV